MPTLFDTHTLADNLVLNNRVVMAPMTRLRTSPGDVPNALMATYYAQRASAGLIISEAADVSPRSKGYAWTPGIYTDVQIAGWQQVTSDVHRSGGKIFLQVWHVGRMAHTSLMPDGEAPWGVTDERASESDVFAHDAEGNMTFVRASQPRPMDRADLAVVLSEFTSAFKNAKVAGFDGVEIHGANGYLFDQFMNSTLNTRADRYGGQSPENRTRLLLEVVDAAIKELGAGKVGVRVSPFGKFNSMPADPHTDQTLLYLCEALNQRGVAYLHLVYQLMPSGNVDVSAFNDAHLSDRLVANIRQAFRGTLIWCGGFDGNSAQAALNTGWVDLIAFGRPFVANPDLAARLKHGWPLTEVDPSTFYTRDGGRGYTDFAESPEAVRGIFPTT
ncbi:MAG: 12-oxophytodienoate reductase [Pseudomonas sp.]|nr:12-oxophytodienoate reductase [Pseudomonas sp.]